MIKVVLYNKKMLKAVLIPMGNNAGNGRYISA